MVFGRCCERGVVGMEGQRDESLEAAGFVLQSAQLQQVVDAVFVVFDVAVEHGGVGAAGRSGARCLAVSSHSSPSILWSQMMWRTRSAKISAPPPGSESTPAAFMLLQRFCDGELGALGEEGDLDHGEGFDVHLREALLEAGTRSRKYSNGRSGWRPPTMWNSVTASV